MDPKHTNSSSQGNTASGKQAIFTPIPSTDKNTTSPTRTNNPILTHPYLTNQPAETGDIILNNDSPKIKQNKRPFIIGVVVLVVFAVVATIIMVVMSKDRPVSLADTRQALSSYIDYLVGENNDEWILLQLLNTSGDGSEIDTVDQTEYVATLNQLYNEFVGDFTRTKFELNNEEKENLNEFIENYGEILKVLTTCTDLDDIIHTIVTTYISDEGSATKIAEQLVPENRFNLKYTKEISRILNLYFSTKLEILGLYRANNCMGDAGIDGACVASLYEKNLRLQQLETEMSKLSQSLNYAIPGLVTIFKTSTNELQERIGALNA